MHNERRRGQRPEPMSGITDAPLYHKRPPHSPCFVRASFANKKNVTAEVRGQFKAKKSTKYILVVYNEHGSRLRGTPRCMFL